MSRLMSVAFTEQAVIERRKTVTRRKGWWTDKNGRRLLFPGDHLTLCRKVMGRKKGEPLVRLAEVEVVDVRHEPLDLLLWDSVYAAEEMAAEGFPDMMPGEFIAAYFTEAQGMSESDLVTRIEWRYLPDPIEAEHAAELAYITAQRRDDDGADAGRPLLGGGEG